MTNPTIELLKSHHSIRKFKNQPVSDDHILLAIEAGQAASTSSAVQAYSIIRVKDEVKRNALIELSGGQMQVAKAGAFFIICGDMHRHRLLSKHHNQQFCPNLESFLITIVDASLFAQNFVIALESLGYGICYVGGLRNHLDEVDKLFNFPEGVYPFYGLCVGVPDEEPLNRPRLPVNAVLLEDEYPSDDTMLQSIEEYDKQYVEYLKERGVAEEKQFTWSSSMSRRFATPKRDYLADFYKSKGAKLT